MLEAGRTTRESRARPGEQDVVDAACFVSQQARGALYQGQCDPVAVTNLAPSQPCQELSCHSLIPLGGALKGKLTWRHFQLISISLLHVCAVSRSY